MIDSELRLNLGCGTAVHDGWLNVDYSLGARFAKLPLFRGLNRRLGLFRQDWDERIFLHDLTRPFPWADASVAAVYSSHTLEHLSREDGRRFLQESVRVLRPGGILRIVVPDLRAEVERYLAGEIKADDFVEELGVLYQNTSGLKHRLAPLYQYPHKCMYDAERLRAILAECGIEVFSRAPFDSAIDDIAALERADRTEGAVILEGLKS